LLTEYHGAPVETEYLNTVEIALALLDAGSNLALEYMPKQVSRSLAWTKGVEFGLKNARFDIAAYNETDLSCSSSPPSSSGYFFRPSRSS
jgi:hypothetical protein